MTGRRGQPTEPRMINVKRLDESRRIVVIRIALRSGRIFLLGRSSSLLVAQSVPALAGTIGILTLA
jgi:hypothetical protein